MRSEQTMVMEHLTATAYGAIGGAIYGCVAGMVLTPMFRRHFRVMGLPPLSRAQFARIGVRDCSASTAAGFGIESVLRGEDDIQSRFLLASGAGLAYSVLRQGLKVRPAHALYSVGAFTLVSGPMFELRQAIRARSERSTRGKAFDT